MSNRITNRRSICATTAVLILIIAGTNCTREPVSNGNHPLGSWESQIFKEYVLKPIPGSVSDLRVNEPETSWDARHTYVMRFKISRADVERILKSRRFEEFVWGRYENDNLYWHGADKVEFDPNTNTRSVTIGGGNLPLYTGPHDEPPEWFSPNDWDNPKVYKFEEKWGKAHRNQIKILIFNEALEEAYFIEYL